MQISWCEDLDRQAAADAFVINRARLVADEAREFLFAAHWADLHNPDSASGRDDRPGVEKSRQYGGDGTPEVLEFAAAELGTLSGAATLTATHLIRDALDVRHRHPQLWARIQDGAHADDPDTDPALAMGHVRVWQARKVAFACHQAELTLEQARTVDAQTTPLLGHCNWGRFETDLASAIIEVDPRAAAEREQAEQLKRDVRLGRSNEYGLTTLFARIESGDAIAHLATVGLIAEILRLEGDTSPANVLRSKAFGIMGRPGEACLILARHGYGLTDPESGTSGDTGTDLDLFGDRPVRPGEGTQPPGGGPEDVPGPAFGASRRNVGFHDREPDPDLDHDPEADDDPLPAPTDHRGSETARAADPDPEPPGSGPPAPADPPDPDLLRPGDLHPAHDDSDPDVIDPALLADGTPIPRVGGARTCPTCGSRPAARSPGESSARGPGVPPAPGTPLARSAAMVAQLVASGVLDKITSIKASALRPRSVLYLHLHETSFTRDADGVARLEHGFGATTAALAMALLGHHHVTVKPVIDLANQVAHDCHEVPRDLREALHLAMPGSVFPYAAYSGQTLEEQDADHTKPFVPQEAGGEPGQTSMDNLGFLGRPHHRVKTFAPGWIHRQPVQGVHLWRNRSGYWYLVDHRGTRPLGKHPDLRIYRIDSRTGATIPDDAEVVKTAESADTAHGFDALDAGELAALERAFLEDHLAALDPDGTDPDGPGVRDRAALEERLEDLLGDRAA